MLRLTHIVLLATCCGSTCAASVLGRRGEGARTHRSAANTATGALDLPRGFKPQPPPVNPLLYPFATAAAPTWAAASTTAGWTPIVGANVAPQRNNFSELAQDHSAKVDDDAQLMEEGPVLESVVYGTWKPDHPVKATKTLSALQSGSMHFATSTEPIGQEVERLGRPHPIVESGHTERTVTPNYGRQKISSREHSLEVISVNASDPKLLDVAKQINDSVESVRPSDLLPTWPTTSTPTSEPQQSNDTPKMWPTDFVASDEQTKSATIPKSKYNADSPQALSGLDAFDNRQSTVPFNITKVGVPYEDGPSICVPLTVREEISAAVMTDMERIYCFPLPSAEVVAADRNNSEMVEPNHGGTATVSSANGSWHSASTIVVLSLLFYALKMQLA